jgi:uncharacterized protein YqjF (DUF2071 family)
MESDQHPSRSSTPNTPWILSMEWHDVLFLHWPVPEEQIDRRIPDALSVETFDGTAWLGIVPFSMSGIRPRRLPAVPMISNFPELNIRTYVTDGQYSGVWFHSLDASSALAVKIARWTFSLNYYHADIHVRETNDTVTFRSHRKHDENGTFDFVASYESGSLLDSETSARQRFLTERYFLFSQSRDGTIYRGRIDHDPWSLRRADVRIDTCEIEDHPVPPDRNPASVLYSPGASVRAWFPKAIQA